MGQHLTEARERLDAAAKRLKLDDETFGRLSYPAETLSASLPVRMDDGTLKHFKAWRCRYNELLGPTKGGIRFHPEASLEEVMTLAYWMTLKCALSDLPFGGGKGAVQVDAKALSQSELERVARAYIRAFATMIGSAKDIPAPDMYTGDVIAWMSDGLDVLNGAKDPAAITGKPIAIGGSEGRDEATGRGAYHVLEALRERLDLPSDAPRIAIEGFGNAGTVFARVARENGYKIVALSDSSGGVYCGDGIDIDDAMAQKRENGTVACLAESDGTEEISGDDLLTCDCDLLVPVALSDRIDEKVAKDLKATAVLEIANGPTRCAADNVLEERGIDVVPDILANAGGVIVSHMEWVQNRTGDHWTRETVLSRLESSVCAHAATVRKAAEADNISLRKAAYDVALERLAAAARARNGRA